MVQLSHPCMATGKIIAFTIWMFVCKVMMSLLFNMLSRFFIAFFPRSKRLNFMATVTFCRDFGAQQNKVYHYFYFSSVCHQVMMLGAMILVFWMLSFKPAFPLSSFIFIKRLFSSSFLSAIKVGRSVICISEFIDISPCSLDSSLCFIQPFIFHDVPCIEVK